MLLSDMFVSGESVMLHLCFDVLSGCVLLLAFPLDHEEPDVSNWFCTAFMSLSLAAFLAERYGFMPPYMYPLFLSMSAACYLQLRNGRKYADVAKLFRPDTVWCVAEENARSAYACAFFAIASLSVTGIALGAGVLFHLAILLLSTALYAGLHYRAYSGRALFLTHRKERKIREIISAGSRSIALTDVQDAQLEAVFERVQRYVEHKRPYLNEKYSLEDLAKEICINKTYVSRAINAFSGKNFRQFINYQRVLYSIEEMKKNPDFKVIELAYMSGFHSVVTYNLCFKMFMDAKPSDYLSRYRLSRGRQKPLP